MGDGDTIDGMSGGWGIGYLLNIFLRCFHSLAGLGLWCGFSCI